MNLYPALATDAPKYWPEVRMDLELAKEIDDDVALAALFHKALTSAFGGLSSLRVLDECCRQVLIPEGMVTVPATIRDVHGNYYHAFFFPEADRDAAAAYEELKRTVAPYGIIHPVYYAPEPLADGHGLFSMRTLVDGQTLHMQIAGQPQKSRYATWWPWDDEDGATLAESPVYRFLEAYYDALEGKHYELIKEIAFHLGVEPPLPDETVFYPVSLPDSLSGVVSYDPHRGVMIHFPMTNSPNVTRKYYLLYFLRWALFPADTMPVTGPVTNWWREEVVPRAAEMTSFGEVRF